MCLGMLLAGYSTYGIIIIRSVAETPVNEGALNRRLRREGLPGP